MADNFPLKKPEEIIVDPTGQSEPVTVVSPPMSHKKTAIIVGTLVILVIGGTIAALVMRSRRGGEAEQAETVTPTKSYDEIIKEMPRGIDNFPHDKDRDGYSDAEEAAQGTSDTEFDTDHDALSDRDELTTWQTDPTMFDTDGDSFGDGTEVLGGYNPRGPGKLP